MTRPRALALVIVALTLAAVGYHRAVEPRRDWVRVARDANYEIAIDRSAVQALRIPAWGRWHEGFEVSYRTDHALPRLHNGKTFDREVVRAVIQCDSLLFKVVSVDMLGRDGSVVARQRTTDDDLYAQRWRHVELGTTEEIAARAACHFGHQIGGSVAEFRQSGVPDRPRVPPERHPQPGLAGR
jgi:hypothetical protein